MPNTVAGKETNSLAGGVALLSTGEVREKRSKETRSHDVTKSPISYRRLQVTLSDSGFERLEAMRIGMNAPSQAEVVREALSLLESVIEEVTAGKQRVVCEDPKNPNSRTPIAFKLKIS
jgi:hypothetical protein